MESVKKTKYNIKIIKNAVFDGAQLRRPVAVTFTATRVPMAALQRYNTIDIGIETRMQQSIYSTLAWLGRALRGPGPMGPGGLAKHVRMLSVNPLYQISRLNRLGSLGTSREPLGQNLGRLFDTNLIAVIIPPF